MHPARLEFFGPLLKLHPTGHPGAAGWVSSCAAYAWPFNATPESPLKPETRLSPRSTRPPFPLCPFPKMEWGSAAANVSAEFGRCDGSSHVLILLGTGPPARILHLSRLRQQHLEKKRERRIAVRGIGELIRAEPRREQRRHPVCCVHWSHCIPSRPGSLPKLWPKPKSSPRSAQADAAYGLGPTPGIASSRGLKPHPVHRRK